RLPPPGHVRHRRVPPRRVPGTAAIREASPQRAPPPRCRPPPRRAAALSRERESVPAPGASRPPRARRRCRSTPRLPRPRRRRRHSRARSARRGRLPGPPRCSACRSGGGTTARQLRERGIRASSMRLQPGREMRERLDHVLFDAAARYAEPFCDLAVAQAVDAVQEEYGAAALGQLRERSEESGDCLSAYEDGSGRAFFGRVIAFAPGDVVVTAARDAVANAV